MWKIILFIALVWTALAVIGHYLVRWIRSRKEAYVMPNPDTCSDLLWEHYENERIRYKILQRNLSLTKANEGKS